MKPRLTMIWMAFAIMLTGMNLYAVTSDQKKELKQHQQASPKAGSIGSLSKNRRKVHTSKSQQQKKKRLFANSGNNQGFSPNQPEDELGQTEVFCKELIRHYANGAKQLENLLPNESRRGQNFQPDNYLSSLAQLSTSGQCGGEDEAHETLKKFAAALNFHSGKVGVILPTTGPLASIGQEILIGMRAAADEHNVDFKKTVVVKDTASSNLNTGAQFAQLALTDQVGIVIGGIQGNNATTIMESSDKIALTSLILSSKNEQVKEKDRSYSYFVFPDPKAIGDALADESKKRQKLRIAFLSPQSQANSFVNKSFRKAFLDKGLQITAEATYTSGDYSSMEYASRTIFQNRREDRVAEFRNLLAQERLKARKEKLAFNPNMVTLPPKIDFDAVFISDNFKNVRHLVQLFKYLGVKEIPVFGQYEWRSAALINPYDPFFERAFFADFIGDYRQLPSKIRPKNIQGVFLAAKDAEALDYRILGWRALDIALDAVAENSKRYLIAKYLREKNEIGKPYFGTGLVFNADRSARWPAFILSVLEKQIILGSLATAISLPFQN